MFVVFVFVLFDDLHHRRAPGLKQGIDLVKPDVFRLCFLRILLHKGVLSHKRPALLVRYVHEIIQFILLCEQCVVIEENESRFGKFEEYAA